MNCSRSPLHLRTILAAAILFLLAACPSTLYGASPAVAQVAGGPQNILWSSIRMAGGLALVLGLLIVTLYFLKRWWVKLARGSSKSHIQVIDMRLVAPKKSIALVEVAGERFLLGVGTESINFLSRISQQAEEAVDRGRGFLSFTDRLTEAMQPGIGTSDEHQQQAAAPEDRPLTVMK
ncbi:MAG: flagellar biosynthetic protein FliO [Deltaproteobacteria bacterium]|nr:flagellar biosynthetic protein FliO [Deltaproteobacteria bacterium]MBW2069719.1 flagellar biosynthetic protein FliO [Deltaproteobacteria bacterium]